MVQVTMMRNVMTRMKKVPALSMTKPGITKETRIMTEVERRRQRRQQKKRCYAQKKSNQNIQKTVGCKHLDMPAEMWARQIFQCETHEERLPLLEQAATEGKGYLLGVSAALSIPVATSKAIVEILRLWITRSQSGQMHLKRLFVDSNPTVSLEPIPFVFA